MNVELELNELVSPIARLSPRLVGDSLFDSREYIVYL